MFVLSSQNFSGNEKYIITPDCILMLVLLLFNYHHTDYQSDTASVKIPELDLELTSGTLGGIVTTVEGLISKISESLERVHGFAFGDSLDDSKRNKWKDFSVKLDKIKNLEESWTLIIDDALANSFVAPATDEIKDDTRLTFEEYERSWEQNEELGLNDMDTSAADVAYDSTHGHAESEH